MNFLRDCKLFYTLFFICYVFLVTRDRFRMVVEFNNCKWRNFHDFNWILFSHYVELYELRFVLTKFYLFLSKKINYHVSIMNYRVQAVPLESDLSRNRWILRKILFVSGDQFHVPEIDKMIFSNALTDSNSRTAIGISFILRYLNLVKLRPLRWCN